jgi:hypothetical protein
MEGQAKLQCQDVVRPFSMTKMCLVEVSSFVFQLSIAQVVYFVAEDISPRCY